MMSYSKGERQFAGALFEYSPDDSADSSSNFAVLIFCDQLSSTRYKYHRYVGKPDYLNKLFDKAMFSKERVGYNCEINKAKPDIADIEDEVYLGIKVLYKSIKVSLASQLEDTALDVRSGTIEIDRSKAISYKVITRYNFPKHKSKSDIIHSNVKSIHPNQGMFA